MKGKLTYRELRDHLNKMDDRWLDELVITCDTTNMMGAYMTADEIDIVGPGQESPLDPNHPVIYKW